jgi:acyl-coenzyme A thioesterase PaaI-like protein
MAQPPQQHPPYPIIDGSPLTRSFGASYRLDGERVIVTLTVGAAMEGPPGFAHGGALAALLDEAMGAAAWLSGCQCVTVHLEYDFRRPVPLASAIAIAAWHERTDGRKRFMRGTLALPDGTLAVESSGIFVPAPAVWFSSGSVLSARRSGSASDGEE